MLVDRGEITWFVHREHLLTLLQALRDDDALRFELCSSVSGVDYLDAGGPTGERLHVVYHLTSMTYRRRIRLEVAVTAEDPRVPSATRVYRRRTGTSASASTCSASSSTATRR